MEAYLSTGRFPSSPFATEDGQDTYIETEVRTKYPFEFLQIFAAVTGVGILYMGICDMWQRLVHGIA